ncbi:NAD(P)-dependent oxidoreductase [Gordonia insulae]|uniref:2-(Hydroxymethyl)glutarate dehydrogenase n=1 Tax=Gordonia insulae TaxID=2420509 RepID=A0A3G8JMQ4_9ACTN|nr:NAD(P)-dependent oxidoreductase [Gordonia insulae]AZG45739.1 2-(hydroxymethyl)glutarate dehydrogenase [Gordonia insulae]
MSDQPLPGHRVAMIGLGAMGSPIATNFVGAGQQLVVVDADPAATARFLDAYPMAVTGEPGDCDVVVLSLPTSDVVDEVVLGDKGLLRFLAPGSIIVDMSSSVPVRTQALARRAAEAGVAVVDAPVSGGVARAVVGDLAVMVGGETAAIEAVRPLLAVTAREIIHVGPAGSAHAAKALNNLLSAVGLFAGAEVLVAGARFGIDPATLLEVLNASSGRNQATETKFGTYVLSRGFDSGFTAALMNKDVGIALDLARDCGVGLEVCSALGAAWASALDQLDAQADQTEVVRVLERVAGVELRAKN